MKHRMVLFGCFLVALGGCEETHLVYVHDMNLGIVVTPITDGGTSKLSVGFDRETFALVPRKGKAEDGDEAMSLTAISKVKAVGLKEIQFGHLIATGDAASIVIEDPQQLRVTAEKVFGRR